MSCAFIIWYTNGQSQYRSTFYKKHLNFTFINFCKTTRLYWQGNCCRLDKIPEQPVAFQSKADYASTFFMLDSFRKKFWLRWKYLAHASEVGKLSNACVNLWLLSFPGLRQLLFIFFCYLSYVQIYISNLRVKN